MIMCLCFHVVRLLLDFPEHEEAPVLFQSLLPPEVDRRTVSNVFQRLLGKASVIQLSNHPFTCVEIVLILQHQQKAL